MDGLSLFLSLSEVDVTKKDAYIVGKNLFNQHPSSENIFMKYFDFLCKLASYPITIDERKFYANEADIALAFFTENVKISLETLNLIKECKSKLQAIIEEIISSENIIAQNALKEIQQMNEKEISKLIELKGKLFTVSKKAEFDSLLHLVQESESALKKDFLEPDQKELYDVLTSEYSNVVSDKLLELERVENVEYNKLAVKSFKKVFESFQSSEVKYKENHSQLYSLVSEDLFGFDATRLFNETLIFFNHIYSYIFNKLDDDGKYRLTQFSIDCERIRR